MLKNETTTAGLHGVRQLAVSSSISSVYVSEMVFDGILCAEMCESAKSFGCDYLYNLFLPKPPRHYR